MRQQFGDDLRALTDAEQDSKQLKAAKRHLLFEKVADEVQLPFPVGPAPTERITREERGWRGFAPPSEGGPGGASGSEPASHTPSDQSTKLTSNFSSPRRSSVGNRHFLRWLL